MSESKDGWDKIDIVAKILLPMVIFALGTLYTIQQHDKDENQKAADRVVTLGKSLSSENPIEQKFAMIMLKSEKKQHPDGVPDEVLSLALPQLINLAQTAPRVDIADQAKQLAIDLSANSTIAQSVKNAVEDTPARIYFHIQDESQRQEAEDDTAKVQNKLGSQYLFPGIQRVRTGPKSNELRYFRPTESEEAKKIASALKDSGIDVSTRFIPGYENADGLRPRTFEFWFGPK